MGEEEKTFDPIQWITTGEAAELTGYTAAYFRQLIQRGKLHSVEKRGRDWFLDKAEVLAYKAKMKDLGSAKFDPWRSGSRQREEGNESGE
ncbi:MAG: helix-turn-helix domain-containing protein [Anaerolineales bacterium]